MFDHRKDLAGRGCIFISAVHILADISESLPPLSHRFDTLHRIEPSLLWAATAALLLHLVLERAFFDRMMAAAHSCNLIVGWLAASTERLSAIRVLCQLSWYRDIAILALLIAAIATMIQILGLRHRRRRASLAAALVILALCIQDGRESTSLPPHSRFEKREFNLRLA